MWHFSRDTNTLGNEINPLNEDEPVKLSLSIGMWYKLEICDSNLWMESVVLSLTTCSQIPKRLLMQGS